VEQRTVCPGGIHDRSCASGGRPRQASRPRWRTWLRPFIPQGEGICHLPLCFRLKGSSDRMAHLRAISASPAPGSPAGDGCLKLGTKVAYRGGTSFVIISHHESRKKIALCAGREPRQDQAQGDSRQKSGNGRCGLIAGANHSASSQFQSRRAAIRHRADDFLPPPVHPRPVVACVVSHDHRGAGAQIHGFAGVHRSQAGGRGHVRNPDRTAELKRARSVSINWLAQRLENGSP
jgi:hypothetical protein